MKRYELYWADLDPVQGTEMAKKRPVVIVSQDALNRHLRTVTVCPVTSQLHPSWRGRLRVKVQDREGEIAVDHIRSISKDRLGHRLGALSEIKAAVLRRLITEMYGE